MPSGSYYDLMSVRSFKTQLIETCQFAGLKTHWSTKQKDMGSSPDIDHEVDQAEGRGFESRH